MTAQDVQSEGIRLQAERVVRAYRTLRASAHSADFTSAEFPVGLFAEIVQQIKLLDGWLQPVEQPTADDVAQPFSEYAESELANIKGIITEIDHLAHDGQESDDPAMTLAVIERLASQAHGVMYGQFWDKSTDGLKRADGGAA